ncbi:MAG: hypothetical protein IJ521_03115, partial [Schwartzia sp.]|nr:hypothetical protein [Schwartzia sp. (in: firmicutes)]
MIYIQKQSTPSSIEREVATLKAESGWKSLADNDTEGLRTYFDRLDKDIIRTALHSEQHGLCAYCMRRIRQDNSMKIEHWKPVQGNKDGVLDYKNWLG